MLKRKMLMYLSMFLFGVLIISGMVSAGEFLGFEKHSKVNLKDAIKI